MSRKNSVDVKLGGFFSKLENISDDPYKVLVKLQELQKIFSGKSEKEIEDSIKTYITNNQSVRERLSDKNIRDLFSLSSNLKGNSPDDLRFFGMNIAQTIANKDLAVEQFHPGKKITKAAMKFSKRMSRNVELANTHGKQTVFRKVRNLLKRNKSKDTSTEKSAIATPVANPRDKKDVTYSIPMDETVSAELKADRERADRGHDAVTFSIPMDLALNEKLKADRESVDRGHDAVTYSIPIDPALNEKLKADRTEALAQQQSIKQDGDVDYYNDDMSVAVYETIGGKNKRYAQQEDTVVVEKINDFAALPETQQDEAIKSTFAQLQVGVCNNAEIKAADVGREVGSTAITCFVRGNKITTASVGDSTAYVVIKDKEGKLIKLKRLNKNLHSPNTLSERERIEKQARDERILIINGRLLGRLAVSRSMGDSGYEEVGLSHEPEIDHDEIDIPKGGQAFVIVACDGLTEKKNRLSDEQYLERKLSLLKSTAIQDLPRDLAKQAMEDGSGDNISVMVMPIDKNNNETKVLAVFDGHGGSEVSHALRDHFQPTLQATIDQSLQQQKNAEHSPDSKKALHAELLEAVEKRNADKQANVENQQQCKEWITKIKQDFNEAYGDLIEKALDKKDVAAYPKAEALEKLYSDIKKYLKLSYKKHVDIAKSIPGYPALDAKSFPKEGFINQRMQLAAKKVMDEVRRQEAPDNQPARKRTLTDILATNAKVPPAPKPNG